MLENKISCKETLNTARAKIEATRQYNIFCIDNTICIDLNELVENQFTYITTVLFKDCILYMKNIRFVKLVRHSIN